MHNNMNVFIGDFFQFLCVHNLTQDLGTFEFIFLCFCLQQGSGLFERDRHRRLGEGSLRGSRPRQRLPQSHQVL